MDEDLDTITIAANSIAMTTNAIPNAIANAMDPNEDVVATPNPTKSKNDQSNHNHNHGPNNNDKKTKGHGHSHSRGKNINLQSAFVHVLGGLT